MIVHDMAQRSPEWFALRLGKLTGSCAGDMLAAIKSGEAAARRDLRMRLVVERLTQQPAESGYMNADMQRGIDLEATARAAYELLTGDLVLETGFIQHPELLAGCSLDGHLGTFDVIVSLKCPKSATHLRYLRAGTMPADYVPQMLHELWITGAKEYHFLSFDDRFPAHLQTCFVAVNRDQAAVAAYEAKALAFLSECDAEYLAVQTLNAPKARFGAVVGV